MIRAARAVVACAGEAGASGKCVPGLEPGNEASGRRDQVWSRLGGLRGMVGIHSDNPAGAAAGSQASAGQDYEFAQRLAQLPAYARSLLRISVPVHVTLASTRQPVSRVLDLAPGTILHFSKPCDDPLIVSVGDCDVAVGETVKVGDKFGLRITSMVMPEEKFEAVGGKGRASGVGSRE
jgi:flagellar motor switch/type III secretory pathway protein FliN